ncbi:ABC transporter substrate-binding protein [Dactylosporangium sp. NPDC000555]|uniref:ABC transporter substrate-binding protein n=1 Tax=Dactylosporangium sp. NPDC000555 TaxID=3154260 RepID=UPI0033328915
MRRPPKTGHAAWAPTMAVAALVLAACGSPAGSGGAAPANGAPPPGGMLVRQLNPGASLGTSTSLTMASMGIAAKHGLNLQFNASGASDTNNIAAVMSGAADVSSASAATLDAIQAGAPLEILACTDQRYMQIYLRNDIIARIGVPPTAPLADRAKALKGLSIATSAAGSQNNDMVRQIVKASGMDPDKDVQVVGLGDTSAIVGGIKTKRFDGAAYSPGVLEQNVADGEASVYISVPNGDFLDLFDGAFSGTIFARKDWVEKHMDAVNALVDSLAEARKLKQANTDAVREKVRTDWFPKLDQKVFDSAWTTVVNAKGGDGVKCTRSGFDKTIAAGVGKDYSKVKYEDVILPRSQG